MKRNLDKILIYRAQHSIYTHTWCVWVPRAFSAEMDPNDYHGWGDAYFIRFKDACEYVAVVLSQYHRLRDINKAVTETASRRNFPYREK